MLQSLIPIIGRAVIPAALAALGVSNAETIETAATGGVEQMQYSGHIVVDLLSIAAITARRHFVTGKKKEGKKEEKAAK